MSPRGPAPAPAWRVQIAQHVVPPRWVIPAAVIEVRAHSAADARLAAIQEAYRRHSLPPWKPCIRCSWPHTTAEPADGRAADTAGKALSADALKCSFVGVIYDVGKSH